MQILVNGDLAFVHNLFLLILFKEMDNGMDNKIDIESSKWMDRDGQMDMDRHER